MMHRVCKMRLTDLKEEKILGGKEGHDPDSNISHRAHMAPW